MFPIIRLGPASIRAPGLIILIGIWIGLTLAEKRAEIIGFSKNQIDNLVIIGGVVGILGARLAFIAQYPTAFSGSLVSYFSLDFATLDLWGGVGALFLVFLIYINHHKINAWKVLDVLTPLFSVLAFFIHFSHFASGKAFGVPTNLPWGMMLWGAERHPTQIYNMVLALLIFLFIWKNQVAFSSIPGKTFLYFVFLSSSAAIITTTFLAESPMILGKIHLVQIVSFGIMLVVVSLLRKRQPI